MQQDVLHEAKRASTFGSSPGTPLLECFAEIRDLIGPMFRGVLETGERCGQEHDRARPGASGFDLHLVKPLDFAALNESLEALLV